MKYANLSLGRIEAIVNRLGGMDGVERFLRGELVVSESTRSWREKDGVIYFSVTSDGTTGKDWITRLERKKLRVGSLYAERVLRHDAFKPTCGVTTEVAVLKGMLFEDSDRITSKIREEADRRKLSKPNAEVACLIRERLADSEIKAMHLLRVIVMHQGYDIGSDVDPVLLGADRSDKGHWLCGYCGRPEKGWSRDHGFAFVV